VDTPLVTIYPPKEMDGGEIGICAVINTSRGPITIMAKGEKAMLSAYGTEALQWAKQAGKQLDPATIQRIMALVQGALKKVDYSKIHLDFSKRHHGPTIPSHNRVDLRGAKWDVKPRAPKPPPKSRT